MCACVCVCVCVALIRLRCNARSKALPRPNSPPPTPPLHFRAGAVCDPGRGRLAVFARFLGILQLRGPCARRGQQRVCGLQLERQWIHRPGGRPVRIAENRCVLSVCVCVCACVFEIMCVCVCALIIDKLIWMFRF